MKTLRILTFALFVAAVTTIMAAAATPQVDIPNACTPSDGILSGGQPTAEQLKEAATAGYKTVISFRTDSESSAKWEPAAVAATGMTYVNIPVRGAADLTKENVARLDSALKEASAKGPMLMHCGGGNRVGAMLALHAAWFDGKDAAAAIEYGKKAGLSGLEGEVRELLESGAAPR